MALIEPCPDREGLVTAIGEAGRRASNVDASGGAAGSISVCTGWPLWPLEVRRRFPAVEEFTPPNSIPALTGKPLV